MRVLEILPWLFCIGSGLWTFLNGLFPPSPEEDPDFYRWEVSEGGGLKLEFLGFRKFLRRPKAIAQGMLSPATARLIAIVVGGVFVIIGALGILHHLGLPPFASTDSGF